MPAELMQPVLTGDIDQIEEHIGVLPGKTAGDFNKSRSVTASVEPDTDHIPIACAAIPDI